MPTVIGARFNDGVALAGDGREVRDGRLISDDLDRIVELENVALGSAGGVSGLDELKRTVDDELATYATRNDRPVTASAFERILATASQHAGVDCLGAVRDDDGRARLLRVDDDGGVTTDESASLGSGAAIATGQLETLRTGQPTADGVLQLEVVLETVAERDTDTGSSVTTVVLEDDG